MVWPMVPAGVSNDAIQVAKDTAPQWDREDDTTAEEAVADQVAAEQSQAQQEANRA